MGSPGSDGNLSRSLGNATRLVVVSRGTAVKKGERLYFQALDGRYVMELAELFGQITLVCPTVEASDDRYQVYSGYQFELDLDKLEVVQIPRTGWRQIQLMWSAIRRGDLVLAFMPNFEAVAGVFVARLLLKPCIVYLGSDWRMACLTTATRLTVGIRSRAWIYGLLEKLIMRFSNLRVVAGLELLDKYISYAPTYQTETLRQMVSDDIYHREDTCRGEILRLLCVASITPRKGLEYLLQACQMLQRQDIPFSLHLVGAGDKDHQTYLADLAESYGIADNVNFEGYVGDKLRLRELYRESDLFVFPSLHEGFPRVLYEAMSQSLPVITTAVGGVPNALSDGQNALLVHPRDASALASSILRLRETPELRRTLIDEGLKRVGWELKNGSSPALQIVSLASKHGLIKAKPSRQAK